MLVMMIIIMVVVANIAIDPVVLTLVTSIVGPLALKGSLPGREALVRPKLLYDRIFPVGNFLVFSRQKRLKLPDR